MGIKGLSSFIEKRADLFYQNFELCDTYLVVDGNNLFHNLFDQFDVKNIIHGGNYAVIAEFFGKFMDELLDCGVEPLVLFDGGIEDKKIQKIIERNNEKIKRAYDFQLHAQSFYKPRLPMMVKVFQDVLKEKNIKYVKAIFEADNALASVARLLNCPLLSYDSDFYLFDVTYIPFKQLKSSVRKSNGKLVKQCKVFRASNLCNVYPGLQPTVLPLMAILLGNDYFTKNSIFENFYKSLKFSNMNMRDNFQRIQAVIYFLQKNVLHEAITKILDKIVSEKRLEVLKMIEKILNHYLQCSTKTLKILGFSEKKISDLVKGVEFKEKFQFEVLDLSAIKLFNKPSGPNEFYLVEAQNPGSTKFDAEESESKVVSLLPPWFLEEYAQGVFPDYFIDLLTRGIYVCTVYMEDCFETPYVETSLKIVKTICQLLSKGITDQKNFKYYARKKGQPFGQEYDLIIQSVDEDFPPLAKLRQISVEDAKRILHRALDIEDSFFAGIPREWQLYVVSIFYWIKNCLMISEVHINALILSLMSNIVDKERGETTLKLTQKVTPQECIALANYFQCKLQDIQNGNFNVSMVHPFLLFQNCLYHIENLNALLGNVYSQPKMSKLYYGTLIFKVFQDSQKFNNCEDFLTSIFGVKSPNLCALFSGVKKALQPAMKKS